MTTQVSTCRSYGTLEQAAQLMWEHDIGALPVLDDLDRVVGMITDRDACMAAYIRGLPLSEIEVASAMETELVTCLERDDAQEVARRMGTAKVHRIPVVDEDGRLQGIVSINDLALAMQHGREVTAADVAETLAAVCAPRAAFTVAT